MVNCGRPARDLVRQLEISTNYRCGWRLQTTPGCHVFPSSDASERAAFGAKAAVGWRDVRTRVKRKHQRHVCGLRTRNDLSRHYDWIAYAAKQLAWHALCVEWAEPCVLVT